MKKKKRIIIGLSIMCVIVICITLILITNKSSSKVLDSDLDNTKVENKVPSMFAIMLETQAGSGHYQESTSSLWPNSGYMFNSSLSKCENGGILTWNDETRSVNLKTSGSDKCYLYFDKYNNPTVNSVSVTDTTTISISISVSASGGTNNVATYYYSINNGEYTSSSSNTHTFSGLNKGTTYSIKVYVKDTNGVDSEVFTINAETEKGPLLADYIKELYTSQGSNGLYYHTSSLANSAGDNSYRYAGANPNNYVCFGSDASTCPDDNLYRIIGVFDNEVKLIKSTSFGNYAWDLGNDNTWSSSDIKNTLNTTYYETLSSAWQNKIAMHSWKVGGMTSTNGFSNGAQVAYNYEVGINSSSITDNMKIGLMYVSDYYYAATNTYWTYPGYTATIRDKDYRLAKDSNWLYLNSLSTEEWTISPYLDSSFSAFTITPSGTMGSSFSTAVYSDLCIRPCFYLTSSTTYVSGSGTSSDPITIH